MLIYTIRRLLGSIIVLLIASFLVFWYVASSFDPLKADRMRNPRPPDSYFEAKEKALNLNGPIWDRYWNWLSHLVDPSSSFPFIGFNFRNDVNGNPISPQLKDSLEVTTRMVIGAIILAGLLAIILGVISGVRRDKPLDIGVTILTFVLIALPTFWFAALLKQGAIAANDHVFHDRVLQVTFEETPALETYATKAQLWEDRIKHLILPTLSLGLLTAASWIRYQRASTIDVLEADYMRLARAKGVRNRTVIRRHGLRNALIPLVTVMAIDVGALFGGAIITEKVYAWNGMGSYLLNTAFKDEDIYGVAGWVMVSAIFVVLFNLLADLLYAVLDPRIRLS
ncbi:MAG: ABC transporter permease [Gordonia polyisoprenivorans]|nr:ABC transporter permease [Gordonia polyisoprenivorans]